MEILNKAIVVSCLMALIPLCCQAQFNLNDQSLLRRNFRGTGLNLQHDLAHQQVDPRSHPTYGRNLRMSSFESVGSGRQNGQAEQTDPQPIYGSISRGADFSRSRRQNRRNRRRQVRRLSQPTFNRIPRRSRLASSRRQNRYSRRRAARRFSRPTYGRVPQAPRLSAFQVLGHSGHNRQAQGNIQPSRWNSFLPNRLNFYKDNDDYTDDLDDDLFDRIEDIHGEQVADVYEDRWDDKRDRRYDNIGYWNIRFDDDDDDDDDD